MKFTLPVRCHHSPNPLLNTFHIRKIFPSYLKPYDLCMTENNNGGGLPGVVVCKLSLLLSYVAIKSSHV